MRAGWTTDFRGGRIMKRMDLPNTQELIWFGLGVWVTFFVLRMIGARHKGIGGILLYLFIAAAPVAVVIFQDQIFYWLQKLRASSPKGG